ncbi:MAG: hypothetical protein ABIM89_11050 [Mycobacteriales bacterium]
MKTTPTGLKILRNRPPQAGHSVSVASVKLWTMSSRSLQAVQAYSYVGTVISVGRSALALGCVDC